jgi:protein dpy-30
VTAALSILSLYSIYYTSMSGIPPHPGAMPASMTAQQMQQMQQILAQQQQQQQMAAAAAASGHQASATPQAPTSGHTPAAAAAAPVPSAPAPASLPQQDLGNLPIRAYLDQTVVPILLDGKKNGMNENTCV